MNGTPDAGSSQMYCNKSTTKGENAVYYQTDFLKEVLKAVDKVSFSGSMVIKMAQLGVMWLACDPL